VLITRSKGGTGERKVELSEVQIPDLWHVAMAFDSASQTGKLQFAPKYCRYWHDQILECWHLCHDLQRELLERGEK